MNEGMNGKKGRRKEGRKEGRKEDDGRKINEERMKDERR